MIKRSTLRDSLLKLARWMIFHLKSGHYIVPLTELLEMMTNFQFFLSIKDEQMLSGP